MNHNDIITQDELINLFNITPVTLWNWRKKGYIKYQKAKKTIHYLRGELSLSLCNAMLNGKIHKNYAALL